METNISTEIVKLPSRGKLYSVEHPLSGKEDVEIKYMTANEEDILTSPALIKRGLVFTTLLKSCLIDKTINPDELLVPDRNAIMIALRCTGYGSEYPVNITCMEPSCGEIFKYEFSLDKLQIRFLVDEHIEEEFKNVFTCKLPKSGKAIKFKLLTATDDRDLDEAEDRKKKAMGGLLVEKKITSRLTKQIISIDGDDNKQNISNYVNKMLAIDSRTLRNKIKEVTPGVIMEQEAICPHCGVTNSFDIPITPAFFWPDI